MDKSTKSRTDLLEAGRKRLQQFRKKKDNKGGSSSHGKPTTKSSKPQQHEADEADAASVSIENVETEIGSDLVTSESFDARVQTEPDAHDHVGEAVMVEGEGERREESLLLSEDIPNTSLIQMKEDDKDAGGFHVEIDSEKKLPLFEVGDSDRTLPGIALDLEETRIGEASHKPEQLTKAVEVSSSLEGIAVDKLSPSDIHQEDETATATAGCFTSIQEAEAEETPPDTSREEATNWSSQEHANSEVHGGEDRGHQEGLNPQHALTCSVVLEQKLPRQLDASSMANETSVNLQQLAEIIRGLSEEEYHFLRMSREPISDRDHYCSETFQRLKELFFLENLMTNILSLQLSEQLVLQLESDNQRYQLIDELSQLRASHNEVFGKNQCLAEELVNCRAELYDVSSRSVELQNQFNSAIEEIKALSARVLEMQNIIEMSQKESADLSVELTNCRGLVSGLQSENKEMAESLALVIEEKNKLAEENEFLLGESKNLASKLSEFKISMEGVKAENSNLSESLSLVTEDRNMIIAKTEHLSNEFEKISVDLNEGKDLVASLQAEISNLNGSLAISAETIKKLEEDKQTFLCENKSLLSKIDALEDNLSKEKGERVRFEADLKEVTMSLDQLTKENIFLNSTLDLHKAKIEEIGNEHSQLLSKFGNLQNQAQVSQEQSKALDITIAEGSPHMAHELDEDGAHEGPPANPLELGVFDDSHGFIYLKIHLDEVEKILLKLENAINLLHSQSVSFGRSTEKLPSPAVSKLIQAFESQGHQDEHDVDAGNSSSVQPQSDSFLLTKEQIENLRTLLTKWRLDVQNAGVLFKRQRDSRKIGYAEYSGIKDQFKALNEHCSNLEISNIELTIQYEAAKQILGEIQEKKCHLEAVCEALKQEQTHLKCKNNEIYEKLGSFQSKIIELNSEIHDVKQSTKEMSSVTGVQLENLQNEVAERAILLEQGWITAIAEVVEAVGKLDESLHETFSSTIAIGTHGGLDICHQLAVSVKAATGVVLDLQKKLEASYSEHEIICTSFKEANAKFDDLLGKHESAVGVLQKMHCDLRNLVLSHHGDLDEDKIDSSEALPDPLNYENYTIIMKYLGELLNEKLEKEYVIKQMKTDLTHMETEMKELNMKCLDLDTVSRLIEDVQGVLNADDTKNRMNKEPVSHLESLVSSLVQKTRNADIQLHIAKESSDSKEIEYAELREKMDYLDNLRLEYENEILILKESLRQAEEALAAARFELHKKSNELEQSEQRVSSVREKLSIAVAKGKGLVVQRDGLKQSLLETSSELERCLEELQLKDASLHEVETKLKTYAEAGERMEALESELSYIRNSSNGLRESFFLKDSMLQRIEEILEDLDLPEQFYQRDIVEKIEWLAKSVSSKSSMNNWDQKDFTRGGSHYDSGYVIMDAWKDGQLQPDSGDDLRQKFEELQSKYYGLAEQNEMLEQSLMERNNLVQDDLRQKFEELQNKYYGLAEQNEMLEQSLMERNNLVQRWEELVDMIDMPSHLRSSEMEDRIKWIGRSLVEANHLINSLKLKIEKYDSFSALLNADLEESKRSVSALHEDLATVTSERDFLSERMEVVSNECDKLSVQTREAEFENDKLHNEITTLKEQLEQKVSIEEQILTIDGKIRKLRDLVGDALAESEAENLVSGNEIIDSLEQLVIKLIENHATLSSNQPACGDALDGQHSEKGDVIVQEVRSIGMHDKEDPDIVRYKQELEEALFELMHVKEERDRNLEKQISLSGEVQSLSKRIEELQEILNQEEQKSASAREKLNVAVRKGKSLVQQRDGLKRTIEEMSIEVENLKSGISDRDHTISEHAQKLKELLVFPDRLESVESERLLLENHLAETQHLLQEREYTLNVILKKLGGIEVGGNGNSSDPVKKLELIGAVCSDLHGAMASLEQESRKSKRASELLLAELNEVQERNDAFQEELAKVAVELADLKKERDSAEAAKLEALSHLEKLSTLQMDGKKSQFSEIMKLKFSMNQLCKGFFEVEKLLTSAFFNDLESFRNLEAGLESCMKFSNATNVVDSSINRGHDGYLHRSSDSKKSSLSEDSWSNFASIDHFDDNTIVEICRVLGHQLQELLANVSYLEENIHMHLSSTQEQGKSLYQLMASIQRVMTSQRESCENMKKEISEKDGDLVALRGNIAYLYEACTNSVIVIENAKAELVGKGVASPDLGINVKAAASGDEFSPFSGQVELLLEEYIKTTADRLILTSKELASIKTELLDANQKEMKATITNLQRELQEKDVQRERICMEFVNQIKDVEATAKSYSLDLQSSRIQEQNLKRQVEQVEAENKILENRVNKLVDSQGIAAELEGKVKSQTDLLAAKDQEIESLMHALDEEEMQMEELTRKIEELENSVQQKNREIENLEASRGKVVKKLSITVTKFDELHHLSASLLAEVEKLQSQLQERDNEISFLRQEVTRCTNEVLYASQMGHKTSSDEIFEFLMWVDMIIPKDGKRDMHPDVKSDSQVHEYKEIVGKKLMTVLSELKNLRAVAESKDVLLLVERNKVDELTRKAEILERSLREKESQLNLLEAEETGRELSTSSEILEVEPLVNKWTTAGTSITPQVRSLRKGNSDHIAIAVDTDKGSTSRIEDEDDDKVHGFKSLTSSKMVPRFTRPVTDMIDGLWVSCDRALMRQPVLRLSIIMYWAIIHVLLAFFVV